MSFIRISKGHSIFNKFISILIIQAFLLSNIAFAVPQEEPNNLTKQQEIITSPDKIIVPRDYGLVKSKYIGKDGKLVIHIQDAHCNYEAQANIVHILENLIRNYNVNFIAVEGADGIIDTSWFKAFPDDEVRKEVATYFMKKGEITGPEFLSITTDYPIKLFGAETRSYYIQNLNAFTSSYQYKEDIDKYFNQIKTVLNRLKNYIYSEELKTLDSKIQDYESKKVQFNDYVRFLETMAQAHKINLREYDNLFKLISVLIYEKKIDFTVTDKERASLIDELSKKLPKDALTELVTKSLSFKVGKISSVEYYDYLKKLAKDNGIDLQKKFPNLYHYIIYNAVYARIENEKLFNDIKNLEIAIKEKLFKNDDQRALEKLSRHIDILLGLVSIKLLNGDFEYYKAHKEEFTHEAFVEFIKKKAIQYGLAYDVDSPNDAIQNSIPKLEDFYSIAIKRDKALVDNTLNAMKKDKLQIGVLVTGGFHSDGITKLLEKQGISHMVVCPNITKDSPSPYIQILTNQRTPFEEILMGTAETKQGMLAPYQISAARQLKLHRNQLLELNRLIGEVEGRGLLDRVEEFETNWTTTHIQRWLEKAERFAGRKSLPRDREILFQAYLLAVDNAVNRWLVKEIERLAVKKALEVPEDIITDAREVAKRLPAIAEDIFKLIDRAEKAKKNANTLAKAAFDRIFEARQTEIAAATGRARRASASGTTTPGTKAVRETNEDILLTDTRYGDAAKIEIERLRREGRAAELEEFVKTVYARRNNIDRMKSVLTEKPYVGYDVIVISSSTPDESEYQRRVLEGAFEGISTDNENLNRKVCILSILDESEGGQIIGQVNTWRRAKEAFREWARDNKLRVLDLDTLFRENKLKIAIYHNGGKGERASPATQSLGNSRGAQNLVGRVFDAKGREVNLELILGVALETAPMAATNDRSRIDTFWTNQLAFGTADFANLQRTNFGIDKLVIRIPSSPKMKDLYDYGTAIISAAGRIVKFLANKRLTEKDPMTGSP